MRRDSVTLQVGEYHHAGAQLTIRRQEDGGTIVGLRFPEGTELEWHFSAVGVFERLGAISSPSLFTSYGESLVTCSHITPVYTGRVIVRIRRRGGVVDWVSCPRCVRARPLSHEGEIHLIPPEMFEVLFRDRFVVELEAEDGSS